jgi:PAS domain S-box-containing protein
VFEGEECTHFIASAKDITTRKNREQLKFLQSDISRIFNNENTLAESLDHTLNVLIHIGDFNIAEIWLVDDEKQTIGLMGYKSQEDRAEKFYDLSRNVKVFMKGEGLPGITWDTGEIQFWRQIDEQIEFVRNNEAHVAGLKTAYGIPIYFDNKVIGMLLLGLLKDHQQKRYFAPLLERLGEDLGSEIDRKQTEEQRNRFFSFSPDIICVAGMDGYFKQVNPAMSRLLGYSQDELLSHPISSFTHPDDRLKTEIEIDALNIDEGSKTFQNRYITKSGKVIWLSWTTRTFAEERKIYSIARDVTEQKELEMLLLQANKMSKFGRWEYEVAEQHTTWSDIVRQIHEVPPGFEPDLDKGIEFYKEGKSRDTISNSISEAIESAQSFDVELQIVTHKGNERWVRVIGDTEIVQGRVKRIYGSFQDIHQRKKAELKQQELSLEREKILESIGDAFFAVNRDWTVTYWNSFAEEQLQMPRDKIVGENLWDVYQDATELEFYSQYHIAMREQVKVSFQQYYPPLEKWFDVSAYPSSDGLSVFFKDITDRKKTEQRLRELNIKLKQQADDLAASNAELEQFAFVASHDLQEPLRMVTSFLTQLEKKYGDELDEKAKRYIWFATDGARRMSQIILDLLNYSRIGRVDINPVQVDLNEVMEAVMREFKKTVEEKDAEVNWDVLPEIVADRSTIHSLMSNLVSNAIKYHTNENRPVVNISSEETDFSWRISVLDNGIGISPEYSDEIFLIFKRLHTIDEYPGTGIGLSVCRKIVENHDGKIWLESSQSKGSTFTFEIPKSSDTQ